MQKTTPLPYQPPADAVCSGGNAVSDRREDLFVRHYMSSRSCSMYVHAATTTSAAYATETPRSMVFDRARERSVGRSSSFECEGRLLRGLLQKFFGRLRLPNGCYPLLSEDGPAARPLRRRRRRNARAGDVESASASLRSEERPINKCLRACSMHFAIPVNNMSGRRHDPRRDYH